MTVFEFAVTYVVCWWMVLFMVLPHQAMPVVKPAPGHAPSAPANPQIGRKIRWTTLIAIAPAVALYFIVAAAQAETIYHAGNKCAPVNATMAADVNAQDGYSTGGKRVAPATIDSSSPLSSQDHYKLPLLIPAKTFGNTSPGSNGTTNVDLSQSFIDQGDLDIGRDGSATLNGQSLTNQPVPEGCPPPSEEGKK